MNQPLTEAIVAEEKPDTVVIATGGKPIMPDIPGIDKPIVTNAQDVLEEKVDTGSKVLIVGSGLIGSETANYLAHHGRAVTIVEQLQGKVEDIIVIGDAKEARKAIDAIKEVYEAGLKI